MKRSLILSNMKPTAARFFWFLAMPCLLATRLAFAQGTAFTYQGSLTDHGVPATGLYDLRFTIYNALDGGSPVGTTVAVDDLGVTNGLFTVTLDSGANVFTGPARWLNIGVRPGASTGAYTDLDPRQPLTAAPYAITAGNLTGLLPASQLTGTIPLAQLPSAVVTNGASAVNLAGTFGCD